MWLQHKSNGETCQSTFEGKGQEFGSWYLNCEIPNNHPREDGEGQVEIRI